MTKFYDSKLLIEKGNKRFEFVESYGIVHEQQFAVQDDWNEKAMYRKLCYSAMKQDKPVNDDIKIETQTMNASFEKETDFDFKKSLVEQLIPSDSKVWNQWNGNGNSGMDGVAQANCIDETHLSNGHRKRLKRRSRKIEPISNLLHEMDERAHQLGVIAKLDITINWSTRFQRQLSMAMTKMCSLKKTTTSWSNGSCNGPATLFKTMWTRYESFGKLEVSDDHLEHDRNPDDKNRNFVVRETR